jgi:hypothetical protein
LDNATLVVEGPEWKKCVAAHIATASQRNANFRRRRFRKHVSGATTVQLSGTRAQRLCTKGLRDALWEMK